MNNLVANLAGVSRSILTTPFIGELYNNFKNLSLASRYTQRMCLQGMRNLACRLLLFHVHAGVAGLTSDPLKAVKSVVDDATQAVSSAAVQAADKVAVSQIKAADQVVHNATVQLANALPENDSELSLPGTQVEILTILSCGPCLLSS